MADKATQTLTARIFKQPSQTEKALRVEVVSNLYEKQKDGKAGSHPLYTTIVLTGGLMNLWVSRLAELVPGARVFVQGDWNFSLFTKKDGSAGFSGSIFPAIFEVNPPRAASTQAPAQETAGATAGAADPAPAAQKEDDLPF